MAKKHRNPTDATIAGVSPGKSAAVVGTTDLLVSFVSNCFEDILVAVSGLKTLLVLIDPRPFIIPVSIGFRKGVVWVFVLLLTCLIGSLVVPVRLCEVDVVKLSCLGTIFSVDAL